MPDLPVAQIFAVQLPGDGRPQCIGKVTVSCPYCTQLHAHRVFAYDTTVFARTAPCSTDESVRRYRIDLGAPMPPKRHVSQPHSVYAAGESLNDTAIDVSEPNWIE